MRNMFLVAEEELLRLFYKNFLTQRARASHGREPYGVEMLRTITKNKTPKWLLVLGA